MYTPCMLLHVYASVCALLYDPPYLPPTHTTTPWLWLRSEWFLASLLKIFGSSSISVTASWMKHDYHHLLHHPQNNNHTNKTSLSVNKLWQQIPTLTIKRRTHPSPVPAALSDLSPLSLPRQASNPTPWLTELSPTILLTSSLLVVIVSSVMFTVFVCFTKPPQSCLQVLFVLQLQMCNVAHCGNTFADVTSHLPVVAALARCCRWPRKTV